MTRVDEIMNRTVVALRPQTSLADAVKLLTDNHISGAPVVDERGRVVGMVSELQLLEVVFDCESRMSPVSHYMVEDVQFVAPGDSLAHAAQLFALYAFRRLPVVDDGRLVGIISRRDLMNHALSTGEVLTEPLERLIPELAESN